MRGGCDCVLGAVALVGLSPAPTATPLALDGKQALGSSMKTPLLRVKALPLPSSCCLCELSKGGRCQRHLVP